MGGCELKVFKDLEIQRCSELGKSGHRAQGKGGPGGCEGQSTILREGLQH